MAVSLEKYLNDLFPDADETTFMAMPETSVHKYNGTTSWENDIRSARKIATMKPKA
jgi:hypothetical protein